MPIILRRRVSAIYFGRHLKYAAIFLPRLCRDARERSQTGLSIDAYFQTQNSPFLVYRHRMLGAPNLICLIISALSCSKDGANILHIHAKSFAADAYDACTVPRYLNLPFHFATAKDDD